MDILILMLEFRAKFKSKGMLTSYPLYLCPSEVNPGKYHIINGQHQVSAANELAMEYTRNGDMAKAKEFDEMYAIILKPTTPMVSIAQSMQKEMFWKCNQLVIQ